MAGCALTNDEIPGYPENRGPLAPVPADPGAEPLRSVALSARRAKTWPDATASRSIF